MVAYWHWHSLHSGQETYWKGVLAMTWNRTESTPKSAESGTS